MLPIVLIPAYKPDEKLIVLLQTLIKSDYSHIIVVNDGSPMDYADIFSRAAQFERVLVTGYDENRGKGNALKHGFQYVLERFGEQPVISADADGQHTPADILKVANALLTDPETFVVGGRAFDKNVPFRSRLGNTFMRYTFMLSTGRRLYDTQSGLRGMPASLLPRLCDIPGDRYEYEMNVLLSICKATIPIKEITIQTVYLENNESSHFHPVQDAMRVLIPVLKFVAASLASFAIDYLFFILLIEFFSLAASYAYALARVISGTVNFLLNKKFVFQDSEKSFTQFIKYTILALCILGLGYLGVSALTRFGMNSYLSKILVDCLLFLLNFSVQRRFIFKS
jgi:glycosyltransferase involved in cell wall biosynthesis